MKEESILLLMRRLRTSLRLVRKPLDCSGGFMQGARWSGDAGVRKNATCHFCRGRNKSEKGNEAVVHNWRVVDVSICQFCAVDIVAALQNAKKTAD